MEWESYYKEAADYYKAALGAAEKKTLGNLVIYNVVAMSIENYMTSVLMKSGFIPEHSSISSMYRELKKNHDAPEAFHAEVRFMNRFMNFCSLEPTPEVIPTDEEIKRMIDFASSLQEWARQTLLAA
jgi:HEPN domain-containing protein